MICNLYKYWIITFIGFMFLSCEKEMQNDQIPFRKEDFDIKRLKDDKLPYNSGEYLNNAQNFDKNGVPLFEYNGTTSYHPVNMAQHGLKLINAYRDNETEEELIQIVAIADKLENIAVPIDSAVYFPYQFDYLIHGIDSQSLKAPWYSGMAQGQVLSFFCRLYTMTNKLKYKQFSKKVFNSFLNYKRTNKPPWVSYIDSNDHLWLEEYPMDNPCHTLNGMIFAIFGLYDYYLLSGSQQVKEILEASITTIKAEIESFRVKDDVSYYCLKHLHQSANYHNIHIYQLEVLFEITGERYFKDMSETFRNDTN